jgi:hypothetical protein
MSWLLQVSPRSSTSLERFDPMVAGIVPRVLPDRDVVADRVDPDGGEELVAAHRTARRPDAHPDGRRPGVPEVVRDVRRDARAVRDRVLVQHDQPATRRVVGEPDRSWEPDVPLPGQVVLPVRVVDPVAGFTHADDVAERRAAIGRAGEQERPIVRRCCSPRSRTRRRGRPHRRRPVWRTGWRRRRSPCFPDRRARRPCAATRRSMDLRSERCPNRRPGSGSSRSAHTSHRSCGTSCRSPRDAVVGAPRLVVDRHQLLVVEDRRVDRAARGVVRSRGSPCRRPDRGRCTRRWGRRRSIDFRRRRTSGPSTVRSRSRRRRSCTRSRSRRPCSRSRPRPRSWDRRGSGRSPARPGGAGGRCRR